MASITLKNRIYNEKKLIFFSVIIVDSDSHNLSCGNQI